MASRATEERRRSSSSSKTLEKGKVDDEMREGRRREERRTEDGDFQFLPPRRSPHGRTRTHTLRWICPLTHSLGSRVPLHSLSLPSRFPPLPLRPPLPPSSPLLARSHTVCRKSSASSSSSSYTLYLYPRSEPSSSMMRSLPLFLSPTHSPPLYGTCRQFPKETQLVRRIEHDVSDQSNLCNMYISHVL